MADQEGINQDQSVDPGIDRRLQTQTMLDTLARLAECSEFYKLVQKAELEYALRRSGLRTLFVPTNGALDGITVDQADEFLTHHLLNGAFETFDLRRTRQVKALDGSVFPVHTENGVTTIANAEIVRANIPCTNGVIQVINGLLTGEKISSQSAGS